MSQQEAKAMRYVPQGPASHSSDAPGWSSTAPRRHIDDGCDEDDSDIVDNPTRSSSAATARLEGTEPSEPPRGPVCWKCRGTGHRPPKAGGKRSGSSDAANSSAPPLSTGQKKGKRLARKRDFREAKAVSVAIAVAFPESQGDGDERTGVSTRRESSSCETEIAKASHHIGKPSGENDDDISGDVNREVTDPLLSQRLPCRRPCPVCGGEGNLPVRSKYVRSLEAPGVITARRRRPPGWVDFGHVPPVVGAAAEMIRSGKGGETEHGNDDGGEAGGGGKGARNASVEGALSLLARANGRDNDFSKRKDVEVLNPRKGSSTSPPTWLPIHPGEQLCNLVGRWRILQRLGSHRWTTDDLVTAYVAASAFLSSDKKRRDDGSATIRYLDLGTGNGSVLQMVVWYLLSYRDGSSRPSLIEAVGVEARLEAVGLAKRSLAFNLGSIDESAVGVEMNTRRGDADVRVVQGDFRDLVQLAEAKSTGKNFTEQRNEQNPLREIASKRYDLITGTPPYFRVDFSTTSEKKNGDSGKLGGQRNGKVGGAVDSAVIRQGGMPTSMQSAPARCEFRGGIEAYCLAASSMLDSKSGTFVVCENWLNDSRVRTGALEAGLVVTKVLPVAGRVGKKEPLFAVYIMKKVCPENGEVTDVCKPLVVRNRNGEWTKEYAKVMDAMSIPVLSSD